MMAANSEMTPQWKTTIIASTSLQVRGSLGSEFTATSGQWLILLVLLLTGKKLPNINFVVVVVVPVLQSHDANRMLSEQQHKIRFSDSVQSGAFIFPLSGKPTLLSAYDRNMSKRHFECDATSFAHLDWTNQFNFPQVDCFKM